MLTDNEKMVTVEHIAGVPVRNAEAVSFGRHYGVSMLTCAPRVGPFRPGPSLAGCRLFPTDYGAGAFMRTRTTPGTVSARRSRRAAFRRQARR